MTLRRWLTCAIPVPAIPVPAILTSATPVAVHRAPVVPDPEKPVPVIPIVVIPGTCLSTGVTPVNELAHPPVTLKRITNQTI